MAANNAARVTSIGENPLCSKLQGKFSGRGAASAGSRAQAVNTAYNAAKKTPVAKAANPFEETVEFTRATAHTKAQTVRQTPKSTVKAAAAGQAFDKTTQFESGTFAAAYARAASIRSTATQYNKSAVSKGTVKAVQKAPVLSKQWVHEFIYGDRTDEVKVKNSPISKGLIITAVVVTLVVMLMIFSFAQINEFKSEISNLQSQKSELSVKINDLNVSLDSKNDIRVIEDIATNQLGMVKSNQVESKYVTIAAGERVEVVDTLNNSDEESYGVFGTLMSAIGSNWNRFMEYIH